MAIRKVKATRHVRVRGAGSPDTPKRRQLLGELAALFRDPANRGVVGRNFRPSGVSDTGLQAVINRIRAGRTPSPAKRKTPTTRPGPRTAPARRRKPKGKYSTMSATRPVRPKPGYSATAPVRPKPGYSATRPRRRTTLKSPTETTYKKRKTTYERRPRRRTTLKKYPS